MQVLQLPKRAPAPTATGVLVSQISARWSHYEAADIDQTISPVDDMFGGNLDYYFRSGLSALDLITEAMVLSGQSEFGRILELPCGGGRVTRHLKAFLPDAKISASDIDAAKQRFVVDQFGADPHPSSADFSGVGSERFDLIFVGSLLTHLPHGLYLKAVDYFLRSLAPRGVAILTMHGRAAAEIACATPDRLIRWRHIAAVRARLPFRGFAYVGSWRSLFSDGVRYGGSFNTASWAVSLMQRRSDVRVLGLKERGWMDLQDVLFVQKV